MHHFEMTCALTLILLSILPSLKTASKSMQTVKMTQEKKTTLSVYMSVICVCCMCVFGGYKETKNKIKIRVR